MEDRTPNEAERARAARTHLLVLLPGLGLLETVRAWRGGSAFVAHHGRQATLATGLLFALGAAHTALHTLAHLVVRLAAYSEQELGAPAPAWAIGLLGVLLPVNWGALCVEVALVFALAVQKARQARDGSWSSYFFLPTRGPTARSPTT